MTHAEEQIAAIRKRLYDNPTAEWAPDVAYLLGRVQGLEEQIRAKIAQIDADPRMLYPSANVVVNAPLAMIQATQEVLSDELHELLGDRPRDWNADRKAAAEERAHAKRLVP